MKYDVALSFAGEDRKYVGEVAKELKRLEVSVFYDEFEIASLWGKDLYAHFQDIYQKQAKFTVIFISEFYAKKLWTNHERKMAQARAFTEAKEYILPARFDDTEIEGIPRTTGYIDLRHFSPEEFCDLICKKLASDTNIAQVKDQINSNEDEELSARNDPLFFDALRACINAKRASTSLLQRHLRIGYGRAAAILDAMVREGFIGEMDGSRARPILDKAYEALRDEDGL